jgi:Animal haem peroxidase
MREPFEHRDRFNLDAGGLGRHGSPGPRGQVARPGARGARFGRMFPFLAESEAGDDAITWLAERMLSRKMAGRSTEILDPALPAGYTYLGQFIDHDVTFDPTSKLQRDNDPDALSDFRTPRLDLDSLYGSGPLDQPFLYDWDGAVKHRGVKLLVGRNPRGFAREDLPRNRQERALIGDARNDENLIVSQLHLLFIDFHNRVVEHVAGDPANAGIGSTKLFEEAQRIVRWHYQWIVLHDFLPRIVESSGARPGLGTAWPLARRTYFKWRDRPFMPVEFSAAAYRFGHSLVREDYMINDRQDAPVPIMNPNRAGGPFLGGFRRLPTDLRIQWENFFPTTDLDPQNAMRIDPYLSRALSRLRPDRAPLMALNLFRGKALGLPAGPAVAQAMCETPLSAEHLLDPLHLAKDDASIDQSTHDALVHQTPLWYYVLCEARVRGRGGQRLGPVGGRIVAEVLLGLLEGDPSSYLNQWPEWKPELSKHEDKSFTMADLVRFTQEPLPG